jgi:hypothetical protein
MGIVDDGSTSAQAEVVTSATDRLRSVDIGGRYVDSLITTWDASRCVELQHEFDQNGRLSRCYVLLAPLGPRWR